MAWSTSILLIVSAMKQSQSLTCTSKSSTQCNIDCDGVTDCSTQVLDCNANGIGLDCYISCNTFETNGCFDSIIYCTSHQYCSIDCSHGCTNITVHAEDAAHLYIKNCNNKKDGVYCSNMDIFCPQHIDRINIAHPICIIEGDNGHSYIESSNIFTKQGFNDLQLKDIGAINTKVYCGDTDWCNIAVDGTKCDVSDDETCNNIIINKPTPQPVSRIIAEETVKPTQSMMKEGKVESAVITTKDIDIEDDIDKVIEYTVIQRQSGDVDLEIVILSGICVVLLMCCVFFCTLWITRGEYIIRKEMIDIKQKRDALKLSDDLTVEHGTRQDLEKETAMKYSNNKVRVGSIFTDNLSVMSTSQMLQSQWTPSMRNNSAMTSDWECDDIDMAFDDVLSETAGEVEHIDIKPDEFIVVGEDEDDCDCETPGADLNNNQ